MLDKFYGDNNIDEKQRIADRKEVLLVVPEKDYDISWALKGLLLDKAEVVVTWPKDDVDLLAEVSAVRAKVVLQLGKQFSRKFMFAEDESGLDAVKKSIENGLPDEYVVLHHHDEFSIRDGVGSMKQLLKLIKAQGRSFCCVTNHGSVGGWIKQYNECKKAGVKAIFGMEAYVSGYRGDDPEERKKHRSANHLVLLAKNMEGFENIIKIHNDAQIDGFYYSPRIVADTAKRYGKGVVATSACMKGEIATALMAGEKDKALEVYKTYSEAFDEFYIEIQIIEFEMQREANRLLIEFAKEVDAPLILACDSHYLEPEHSETHDLLMCIRQGKTIMDQHEKDDVWSFEVKNLYYRNASQMRDVFESGYVDRNGDKQEPFKDDIFTEEVFREAMANTRKVAVEAEDIELDSTIKLPKLYQDSKKMLRKKVNEGFTRRGLGKVTNSKEYLDRVRYEFDVINKLGWADYFLVMDKIVSASVEKFGEWAIGYGRGSAAGSLVSYCLGLTDIDPVEYGLLFERFLDEGRPDPPDIDTDFDPRIREWVKQYIVEAFGEDNVCSIGTYQTYKTRAVILDVARALGEDVIEANQVTKRMDPLKSFEDEEGESHKVDDMGFDELCEQYPELNDYFEIHPDVRMHSEILRNQVKNMGTHAGGMIISDMNLKGRIPVLWDKASSAERKVISAWAEAGGNEELSSVGLVKFDLLGLNNLPVISDCVKLIEDTRGEKLKRHDMPIDDREAIKIGSKENLVGIFQLENPGTFPIAKEVGLESLADVSALTSLIRPGPRDMGMDMTYAKRKHGEPYESIEMLEEIMEETHGVMTYQEQMMKISRVMCGFDGPMSNKLRKACGKKIKELMDSIREKFIEGAQPNIKDGKVTQAQVEKIWDLIASFAKYSFNKTVDKDELVLYSDGRTARIEDVKSGDRVVCFDGNGFVETEVIERHDHGCLPAYEYVFDDGSVHVCTVNHKFLTSEGQLPIRDVFKRGLGVYAKGIEKLEMSDVRRCISDKESIGSTSEGKRTFTERVSEEIQMCGVRIGNEDGKGMQSSSGFVSECHRCGEQKQKREVFSEPGVCQQGSFGNDGEGEERCPEEDYGEYYLESGGKRVEVRDDEGVMERPTIQREGDKDFIGNSQEDISETGDSKTENCELGSMEKRTPRGVQGNNQKGSGVPETLKGRRLATGETEGSQIQKKRSGSVREEDEASGLCEVGYVDRSRRSMALRSGLHTKTLSRREGSQEGFDAEQRSGKASNNISEAGIGVLEGSWKENTQGRLDGVFDADDSKAGAGCVSVRRVLSERFVGVRQMYDLEVSHPSHNFCLASGLVTSNSHAVCYSAISTVELWLKYNYPVEYMTALINNTKLGKKKHGKDVFVWYMNYARKSGIEILGPDISKSKTGFTIENGKIRFSLGHIKNVASQAKVVESFQPIKSVEDFHERVKAETVSAAGRKSSRRPNKKVVEHLIAAGAFDCFGTRNEMIAEYYKVRKNKKDGDPPERTDKEWQELELEVTGMCLSIPPLYKSYQEEIKEHKLKMCGDVEEDIKRMKVFGRIEGVTAKRSKAGNQMFIVQMGDGIDSFTFFVFQAAKEYFKDNFRVGMIVGMPLSRFDDGGARFFDDRGEPVIIPEKKDVKVNHVKKDIHLPGVNNRRKIRVLSNGYEIYFSEGDIEYEDGTYDQFYVSVEQGSAESFDYNSDFVLDKNIFLALMDLGSLYGEQVVYDDFLKFYNMTKSVVEGKEFGQMQSVFDCILELSKRYRKDALRVEVVFSWLYSAMVAEENKRNTKLGKRVKRLGVYQVLIENMSPENASEFSCDKTWQWIDGECEKRGL